MKIRKAYQTDVYKIVKVHDIVWKTQYYDILPVGVFHRLEQNIEKRINHLKDQISENNRIFVAINDDDEVVGYIFYAKTINTMDDANIEIREIHILPEYQKMGIGTMLLDSAIEEIKKLGYHSLIAYCPYDSSMLTFFTKKGAIVKKRITKEMEGYPVIYDLIYLELENNTQVNMSYAWNNLYLIAGEYLYLLNENNHEIAVILTENDNTYIGLGIKNYVCAVTNAISNMYLNNENKIKKILILNKEASPVLPCGKCRDFLMQTKQEETEILFDIKTFKALTIKEITPYYK